MKKNKFNNSLVKGKNVRNFSSPTGDLGFNFSIVYIICYKDLSGKLFLKIGSALDLSARISAYLEKKSIDVKSIFILGGFIFKDNLPDVINLEAELLGYERCLICDILKIDRIFFYGYFPIKNGDESIYLAKIKKLFLIYKKSFSANFRALTDNEVLTLNTFFFPKTFIKIGLSTEEKENTIKRIRQERDKRTQKTFNAECLLAQDEINQRQSDLGKNFISCRDASEFIKAFLSKKINLCCIYLVQMARLNPVTKEEEVGAQIGYATSLLEMMPNWKISVTSIKAIFVCSPDKSVAYANAYLCRAKQVLLTLFCKISDLPITSNGFMLNRNAEECFLQILK